MEMDKERKGVGTISFKLTRKSDHGQSKRKRRCLNSVVDDIFKKAAEEEPQVFEDDAVALAAPAPLLESEGIKAERLRQEGNTLAEAGRYVAALQRWDQALQITPQNYVLHELKAQILMEMGSGHDFQAIQSASEAVKNAPEWPPGLVTLARAQVNFGELSLAANNYRKALAILSSTNGDKEEATEELEQVCALLREQEALFHQSSLDTNASLNEKNIQENEKVLEHSCGASIEAKEEVKRCFMNLSIRATTIRKQPPHVAGSFKTTTT